MLKKQIYLIFILIVSVQFFSSCEKEENFNATLIGTWQGSPDDEDIVATWKFDSTTVTYSQAGKVAVGNYTTDSTELPYKVKIEFIKTPESNAGWEGIQYYGLVSYTKTKLYLSFKYPIGIHEYPEDISSKTDQKNWILSRTK